ncbi:DUF4382 domain-containing protein [Natronomonas sp.]|uniref:DUF4382 domain-containing protein n=1 Tax=Natronomonas sp. TaxID=2184060 RepID=UPI002602A526|nr:DUF4382 domain-containing protein [Natronomonas sp.]
MERRQYVGGLGAAVLTGTLAGCAGAGTDDDDGGTADDDTTGSGDGSETGLLSTSVTDQPNDIGDFESLVVSLDGIWVKPEGTEDEEDDADDADDGGTEDGETAGNETQTDPDDGETAGNETQTDPEEEPDDEEADDEDEEEADEGSGRRYIEFEEPQDADLVGLQGDESQFVDETELEVGDYQFLQLDVADTTGILAASGEEADVETPGNAPLQFKQAFEIRPDERTRFIADFAPFRIGPPDSTRYRIRPVASGTQVIYGDGEGDTEDDGEDDSTDDSGTNSTDTDSNGDADNQTRTDDGDGAGANSTEN